MLLTVVLQTALHTERLGTFTICLRNEYVPKSIAVYRYQRGS
jgi:hypothetical protein